MKKIILGETIVRVLWEDAWSDPAYTTLDEISREGPYMIETVGYVIRNNKNGITTARERITSTRFRNVQHVSRAMIRKVDILK